MSLATAKVDQLGLLLKLFRQTKPFLINDCLVIEYQVNIDDGMINYYQRDGSFVFSGSIEINAFNDLRPISINRWHFSGGSITFNYKCNEILKIIQFMLDKLKTNPTCPFYTDDPEHNFVKQFWFGSNEKYSLAQLLESLPVYFETRQFLNNLSIDPSSQIPPNVKNENMDQIKDLIEGVEKLILNIDYAGIDKKKFNLVAKAG